MQLSYGFSSLLVSILCVTSLVDARPTPGNAGAVTLPLRTVQVERAADLHPHIRLQQHMNRAIKRHAQMTGRQLPTAVDLRDNLVKRAIAIESTGAATGLSKRLQVSNWAKGKLKDLKASGSKPKANAAIAKAGKAKAGNVAAATQNKLAGTKVALTDKHGHVVGTAQVGPNGVLKAVAGHGATNNAAAGRKGKGKGGKGKGKGGVTPAAAAAAAGTVAATNATTGDALATSTADEAGAGFDQVNLDAALNGGLTAADDPNADDTLGLDIEANDIGYIATVQMGTPPRDFKLLMDSGSADLWVGGENCVNQLDNGGCGNHTFLGTQSSSTFVDSGKPFEVTYGSGNVKGTIVTDDVNLGSDLSLKAHTFGVATSESDDFANVDTPFDGLMGLAQSLLSQQGVDTPPEALAKNGGIKDAIVAYKLSRLADQKNDGAITFGGVDNTLFDANTLVTFNNVNTQGFWEGDFSVSVDGTDLGLAGRKAILDTGTSLILAPPDDVAAFHDAIPGARPDGNGGFIIPCTTSAKVAFTFAGTAFEIDPRDLLFVPLDQNNLTGDCASSFTSGQIGDATEWLVGDVFLKNAYFVTDVTKNQIQLAKLI